jgi:hypothetical protein
MGARRAASAHGRTNVLDLGDLEKRLNEDKTMQKKFLKDPVKLLRDEGVRLAPDMEEYLKSMSTQIKVPRTATARAARQSRAAIMISIRIEF